MFDSRAKEFSEDTGIGRLDPSPICAAEESIKTQLDALNRHLEDLLQRLQSRLKEVGEELIAAAPEEEEEGVDDEVRQARPDIKVGRV